MMSVQNKEATIVSKPAFRIVGVCARVKPGDEKMMQTWNDLMPQMQRIRGVREQGVFYGAMHNYDEASSEFDYVAGVEVESQQDAPEGMVAWDIPEQAYAVFETTLPAIGPMYDYIYNEWLASSGYMHADAPEFEYYGREFDPNAPDSKMNIYVPLVKP